VYSSTPILRTLLISAQLEKALGIVSSLAALWERLVAFYLFLRGANLLRSSVLIVSTSYANRAVPEIKVGFSSTASASSHATILRTQAPVAILEKPLDSTQNRHNGGQRYGWTGVVLAIARF
jgi:hypothetical protein